MSEKPKYVIECQVCKGSLTIVYDGDGKMNDDAIQEHLRNLLQTHVSMEPGPHKESKGEIPKKDWAKKVRPL